MPQELTVLSVRQPWASLLLTGEDWCENRNWDTQHRGPLWIHASSGVDKEECRELEIDPSSLPVGAILGCVELVDVIDTDSEQFPTREFEVIDKYELHPYGTDFIVGPLGWIVTKPQPLATPIPVKGKLRLWTYHPDPDWQPEFVKPKPLLNWPRPDRPKIVRTEVLVNGVAEPLIFTRDSGGIAMHFMSRYRKHIPMPQSSSQYERGAAYYRAGCEKAWELFPDKFPPPA